jgi:hypothetical protein
MKKHRSLIPAIRLLNAQTTIFLYEAYFYLVTRKCGI